MSVENPFKGPNSYEAGDKFYGRDTEIKKLIHLIRNEALTLLFSRSGTGKSSLIKAGVFPELKTECEFFPVYIYLNEAATKETSAKNLCDFVIKKCIEEAEKTFANRDNFRIVLPQPKEQDSLFEFIHGIQILEVDSSSPQSDITPDEYPVKPVLFFDQFEEILTQPFDKTELQVLLKEIRCLLENEVPAYLKDNLASPDSKYYIRLKNALKSKQKNFRIVFSFREEYLPQFESLKKEILSIRFTNSRYRLEPFTTQAAQEVITKTASAISREVALSVANNIAVSIEGFDEKRVDPFLLSLICQIIYLDLISLKKLPAADTERDIKALVEDAAINYVKKVYAKIGEETKEFIEKRLITSDGKKNSINYNEVEAKDRLRSDVTKLAENPDLRLLSIGQFLDSKYVSVLHDRLLPLLIERKEERQKKEDYQAFLITQKDFAAKNRKRQRILAGGIVAGLILFGILFTTISLAIKDAGASRIKALRAKAISDSASLRADYQARRSEKLRREADSAIQLSLLASKMAKTAIDSSKKVQKELTRTKKQYLSLHALTDSLQLFKDSNTVAKDMVSYGITFSSLDNNQPLYDMIFSESLQLKRGNETGYTKFLLVIDSALIYKYLLSNDPNAALDRIKPFWNRYSNNQVLDSLLTYFANRALFYKQKETFSDEANYTRSNSNIILPSSSPGSSKADVRFAFNFNNNVYYGSFDTLSHVLKQTTPYQFFNSIKSKSLRSFSYTGDNIYVLSDTLLTTYLPGKTTTALFQSNAGHYSTAVLSPNGEYAITYTTDSVSLYYFQPQNNPPKKFLFPQKDFISGVQSVSFSDDSKLVLVNLPAPLNPVLYTIDTAQKRFRAVQDSSFESVYKNFPVLRGYADQPIVARFVPGKNQIVTTNGFEICLIHLTSKPYRYSRLGKIPYSVSYASAVSVAPDMSSLLLTSSAGMYLLTQPDGEATQGANYKAYYNSRIVAATFLDSKSILAVNTKGESFIFQTYPDFQNIADVFAKVKAPKTSIFDSIEKHTDDVGLYNEIYKAGNPELIRKAARIYLVRNPDKAFALYDKLIALPDNTRKTADAFYLITTLKSFADSDTSYANKVSYLKQATSLAEKFDNVLEASELSTYYGDLAFYSFFVNDPGNGLACAQKGLAMDSANNFICTNLALGYLLTRQFEKAEDIYNRYKDSNITDNDIANFYDGFLSDFKDLKEYGIINRADPELWEEVERIKKTILQVP